MSDTSKRPVAKTIGALVLGACAVAILAYGRFWGLALLTVGGLVFLDFRAERTRKEARAFRNEVRARLEKLEDVPELLRSVPE